jgi:predicted O-methyltransferase YrrM
MRVLEIGTATGDITLLLVRALPAGRQLLTMEASAPAAAAARQRFASADVGDRISVMVGEPTRFLHKVRGPFDVIVVNVPGIPRDRVERLLAPGGIVVANHATISVNDMTIAEWLALAKTDATTRRLPELLPMLDGLAQATERLRAADWNDDPSTRPSSASALADLAQNGPSADDDDR